MSGDSFFHILFFGITLDIVRHGKYFIQLIQDGHRNALGNLLAEVKKYYVCALRSI
jgi:hypothetical protein